MKQFEKLYAQISRKLQDKQLPSAVLAKRGNGQFPDTVSTNGERDYGFNLNRLSIPFDEGRMFGCTVPNIATDHTYLINDQLLSSTSAVVKPFTDPSTHDTVNRYYEFAEPLNNAFLLDGLLMHVPKGKQAAMQQIVNFNSSPIDLMIPRRLMIVLEEEAELSLLTCDHSLTAAHFLATHVTEIYLHKGAKLNLCSLEETTAHTHRLHNIYIRQEADSILNLHTITLSFGHSTNNVNAYLQGQGAKLILNGTAMCAGEQRLETTNNVFHTVPQTEATELYKFILDDHAVAHFNALTRVEEGAQQTQSRQTAKAIALSSSARLLALPQLEIYADDVKCGHGAGIGQIDRDALFYMQQRGISFSEARHLLLSAFLAEVIDTIDIPHLSDRLRHLIDMRLRGGSSSSCATCRAAR